MGVISKAQGAIMGPTVKSHLGTARYILRPVTSISVSPSRTGILAPPLLLSKPAFLRTLLARCSLTTPKQKENANWGLKRPREGTLGSEALQAPVFSCLAALALGVTVTYTGSRQGPFASKKNHSWGDFLPSILL